MEINEPGTLSKKPVLFLCSHKASSFVIISVDTQRKYRFLNSIPYLVKYDEDIEFFDSNILFSRVEGIDKSVDSVNEEIADAVQGVIEKDANKSKKKNTKKSKKIVHTKESLETLPKSKQIKIIRELGHKGDTPLRKQNRVELILKIQGEK